MARKLMSEPDANLLGLVQACKDEPDDAGLRGILADYLEDHGEPERAELMRLSVAARQVEPESAPGVWARLARLRRSHDARWLGGIAGKGVETDIEAGFVSVKATVSNLRTSRVVAGLEAVAPWTERLRLGGQVATVNAFLQSPLAAHFSALAIDMELNEKTAKRLAAPDAGPRLRELSLRTGPNKNLALLSARSHLRGLSRLCLHGSVSPREMRALGQAPFAAGLRSLRLVTLMNADTIAPLAQCETLIRLENLHIGLDSLAIQTLAGAASFRPRRLTLSGYFAGENAVIALARSPLLTQERHLGLNTFSLTPASLMALAASPYLENLESLDLSSGAMSDDGARALASGELLPRVRHLDLSYNQIGPVGAAALVDPLHRVESLALDGNPVGDEGLAVLARGEKMPCLRDLSLANVRATDSAIEPLLGGSLAHRLRRLNLSNNGLGTTAFQHLARSPALVNLESLQLNGALASPEGLTALARSTTLQRLVWLTTSIADDAASLAELMGQNGLPSLVFLGLASRELPAAVAAEIARTIRDSPRQADLFLPFCVAKFYPSGWLANVLAPVPRNRDW